MMNNNGHFSELSELKQEWAMNPRWTDVVRPYSAEDVLRLRGSIKICYTMAERSA
jgi:isocitrate/methylisocitrate lyase